MREKVYMLLLIGLGLFVLGCVLDAIGSDWETSEHNANVRAQYIADTINSHESIINIQESEYKYEPDEEEYEPYTDNRGRLVRKRIVYDSYGHPVAEEILEIGFND